MTPSEILRSLLAGKSRPAEKRFAEYLSSVNNCVSWYPSAGHCYRDLLLWNYDGVTRYLKELPGIFIHTDYDHKHHAKKGLSHDDGITRVEITGIHPLEFKEVGLRYQIDREYTDFLRKYASPEPRADLLDVRVISNVVGKVESRVLYFYWENINFLQEIVLDRKLQISHFFKLREGCGMGGNRKSISLAYGFLGDIGCRYLLVDDEVHFDWDLFERMCNRRHPKGFALRKASNLLSPKGFRMMPSGFSMKLFKVSTKRTASSKEDVKRALRSITRRERLV